MAPLVTGAPPETPVPAPALPWWRVVLPGACVGAASALIGLDRASLWRDEAYSLGAVHQLGTTLRETRGTMGLYYVILRGWATVSDSAAWLRLLSVVLALGALLVVVHLARRLLGDRPARAAGVFLGLSLLWVAYAQEARSYALVMLLVASSWAALDHGMEETSTRASRWWWHLHTACCLLLPLAHGLAVLQVLAQPVALGLGRAPRRHWRAAAPGVVGGVALTGALAVGGTSEAGSWIVPLDLAQLRIGVQSATSDMAPFTVALVAAVALGAAVAVRRVRRLSPGPARVRAAVPLTWAVVPPVLLLAVSLVRPSFVPRYVVASAAGVALLLAIATSHVDGRRRGRLPVATILVAVVLALGQVDMHRSHGDDWRTAAHTVAVTARPGDVLLLAESEVRPPFEAAWREVDDRPDLPVVNGPRPLGEVRRIDEHLPDAVAVDRAGGAGRVWLVGETRASSRIRALAALTGSDASRPTHDLARTWDDGGISVHLLVAR